MAVPSQDSGESPTTLYVFVNHFPKISPNNITELDREWRMLRNVDFSFNQNKTPDIIDFWKHVQELRNGDESQTFPIFCELVKKLLCLPQSSAAVEVIFCYKYYENQNTQ